MTINEALAFRKERLETVAKCYKNESLAVCMERIVKAEVHRLVVVDQDEHVIGGGGGGGGVLSLSDLLHYIVIRPTKTSVPTNISVPTINISNEDGQIETPADHLEWWLLLSPFFIRPVMRNIELWICMKMITLGLSINNHTSAYVPERKYRTNFSSISFLFFLNHPYQQNFVEHVQRIRLEKQTNERTRNNSSSFSLFVLSCLSALYNSFVIVMFF